MANTERVLYVIQGHDGRGGVRPRKFVFPDEIDGSDKAVAELRRLWMVKEVYASSNYGHTSIVVRVRHGLYNFLMPSMARAIARALDVECLHVESVEYSPDRTRVAVFDKDRWGNYRLRKVNRGMIFDL